MACAAFTALSMFDPSDFKLIHLPEKVQVYNYILLKSPVCFFLKRWKSYVFNAIVGRIQLKCKW